MNFSKVFDESAKRVGLTPVYATLRGANVEIDSIRAYPIIVRPFDEVIRLLTDDVPEQQRTIEVYVAENFGDREAAGLDAFAPLVDSAVNALADFVGSMRAAGVQVQLGDIRPMMSRFDALEVGVAVSMTFTYRDCRANG